MRKVAAVVAVLAAFAAAPALAQQKVNGAPGQYGGKVYYSTSLEAEPIYPPDFKHWNYVNPTAPKGGELRTWRLGTFDSLNVFISAGRSAGCGCIETLMTTNADEHSAMYGLIAEYMEHPDDPKWVVFKLRDEAKWWDGTPITADDVIFSLEKLKAEGQPYYRQYFKNVVRPEKLGEKVVKFNFDIPEGEVNKELAHISGQLPIISKAYWSTRNFTATTLEPFLSSGPYRVKTVNAPSSITLERVPNYWGANLPVNVGLHNFETLRTDLYLDQQVALEAFKAGEYDFRVESQAARWAVGYDGPALQRNLIIKALVPDNNPKGIQAFVLNTRKEKFQNRKTREALQYVLDFEWSNKTLFYDQYKRARSFFENSEFSAKGTPGRLELEYLEPLRSQIPAEVFTTEYNPPKSDGTGNNRAMLMRAQQLLQEAGWRVQNGRLVNAQGQPFQIEFLLVQTDFERLVNPVIQNLDRLGISATVRTIEAAQYQQRLNTYDFDIMVGGNGQSLSPGNEQREMWTCAAAREEATDNLGGICNPAVEALVDKIISAPDRERLVAATRALDRVLQWEFYVIPQWYLDVFRIAYWDKFGRPATDPLRGVTTGSWWFDTERARRTEQARAALR